MCVQSAPPHRGLDFTQGSIDDFEPEPQHDPLDAILNDNGVVWPVSARQAAVRCIKASAGA